MTVMVLPARDAGRWRVVTGASEGPQPLTGEPAVSGRNRHQSARSSHLTGGADRALRGGQDSPAPDGRSGPVAKGQTPTPSADRHRAYSPIVHIRRLVPLATDVATGGDVPIITFGFVLIIPAPAPWPCCSAVTPRQGTVAGLLISRHGGGAVVRVDPCATRPER